MPSAGPFGEGTSSGKHIERGHLEATKEPELFEAEIKDAAQQQVPVQIF
jgi:hypothetical protein